MEGGNKRKNEQIGHRRNRCRNRAFTRELCPDEIVRDHAAAAVRLLYSLAGCPRDPLQRTFPQGPPESREESPVAFVTRRRRSPLSANSHSLFFSRLPRDRKSVV